MRINNEQKTNFKSFDIKKPLGQFYNPNATIPTLVIETGVTLGRAYEANKRGGAPEAIDRLVEQGVGAVAWIYGVKGLKKLGELIGEKIFKIKDFNFDIGFDELRNPTRYINKKALGFKAINLLASTAIATYFMGAILPKINNAILKKTLKKEEEKKKEEAKTQENKQNEGKNPSFTSLYDVAVNSAHVLENNSTARLLITDTGVIAGRFQNAQNKYRKIEALFRDVSSIFFYLFSTQLIVDLLNKFSKNTNINPKTLEKTVELLKEKLNGGSLDSKEFENLTKTNDDNLEKLLEAFDGKRIISVKKFTEFFPDKIEKAREMAKLQFVDEGEGYLSFKQAKDVLSDSITSNPKFLKETYDYTTGKDVADKLTYVSSKYLDKTRDSIDNFVAQIKRASENGKIDINLIEKVAKKNMRRNLAYNVVGTAISIFALAIAIPKVQYGITKKLTNENKFHTEVD